MKTRVVTVRRRFSKLDKALLIAIGVLVLITVMLTNEVLSLSSETSALASQVSDATKSDREFIAVLEARITALEQMNSDLSTKKAQDVTLISYQTNAFTPTDEIPLDYDLQEHIYDMSVKYDIPFELMLAVIDRESKYELALLHSNRNGSTDVGLMQINSCNWNWLSSDYGLDVSDTYDNIESGALILSVLWHKYEPEEALAAYNMGEGNLAKYGVNTYGREVYQEYLRLVGESGAE